jgi:hypothetical protein
LGWRQLFNGRWSTKWARLQDRYLTQHFDPIPEKLRGQKWTSAHIELLWTNFRKLWDSCSNGKVHGVDMSTRAEARCEKTHRKIHVLYKLQADMRHCDKDIFYPTADHHIAAQPIWAPQNWLKIQVPMAKHSIKEAAKLAIRHVCTLFSYFGRPTVRGRTVSLLFPWGDSGSIIIYFGFILCTRGLGLVPSVVPFVG